MLCNFAWICFIRPVRHNMAPFISPNLFTGVPTAVCSPINSVLTEKLWIEVKPGDLCESFRTTAGFPAFGLSWRGFINYKASRKRCKRRDNLCMSITIHIKKKTVHTLCHIMANIVCCHKYIIVSDITASCYHNRSLYDALTAHDLGCYSTSMPEGCHDYHL